MKFSPKLKKSLSVSRFPFLNLELSPRIKRITLIVILIIAIFILNFKGINQKTRNIFYSFSSPLQRTFWRWGDNLSDFFAVILQRDNFQKENENLKTKIDYLLKENIQLKELKKENETLRKALKVGTEKEFQLEMAQIINKDISEDSLLINKGSRNGIKADMPVITEGGILLGRTDEIFEKYSRVSLITNKKSSLNAVIPEKDTEGVVKGEGGFRLSLNLVPKEKEILAGDLVITSQLGGIFPRGLLIGEISNIKKSDVEPFQQAEIKPFLNIKTKETEILFIITDF